MSENKYALSDIDRALSNKHHFTLKFVVNDWRREIHEIITERLWPYDESPEEKKLTLLIETFESEWKLEIQGLYRKAIDKVEAEVAAHSFISDCRKLTDVE